LAVNLETARPIDFRCRRRGAARMWIQHEPALLEKLALLAAVAD
jgi:hypothetical protein